MATEPARRYRSPHRRMQADQTRAAVLAAATRLFAEQGWVDTSMRQVAKAAGVSTETVYSAFGSKRDLLIAVVDAAVVGDDLPIPLAERQVALDVSSGTLAERVGKAAALSSAISGRTHGLVRALTQGAATDPLLAQRQSAMDERRRGDVAHFFEAVFGRAPTPVDLDEVWLLTSAEVFDLLVHRSGWTTEQHEHWLAARVLDIATSNHARPQGDPAQPRRKQKP